MQRLTYVFEKTFFVIIGFQQSQTDLYACSKSKHGDAYIKIKTTE